MNRIVLYSNVQRITTDEGDYRFIVEIAKNKEPSDSGPVHTYFYLESQNHAAFAHFILESAIFLPTFLQVKQDYPDCKLVLESIKDYKRLLLKWYGVSLNDVILAKDMKKDNNVCFFHDYLSLMDPKIPSSFQYGYIDFLRRVDQYPSTKDISILYLPRGKKENLKGMNDRTYSCQELLESMIPEVGGSVYHTDTTENFEEQIAMIRRAKVLLLDYGSSFWINGSIAYGSHIVCMNIGWHQHELFPSYKYLFETIQIRNTVDMIWAIGADTSSEIPNVYFRQDELIRKIQECIQQDPPNLEGSSPFLSGSENR